MVDTTWNYHSFWQKNKEHRLPKDRTRYPNGKAKRHALQVVEEEERTYVVSRAGILQRQSGLGDVVRHLSKGFLILPVILVALAVPVATPLLSMGEYMILILCLCHLILVATVLTVWAIAISYIDMLKMEESLEARPMTAADGDPSMGARTPEVQSRSAA